jgi:hypothetical protein
MIGECPPLFWKTRRALAQRAEAPDVRKTYSNSWRPGLLGWSYHAAKELGADRKPAMKYAQT